MSTRSLDLRIGNVEKRLDKVLQVLGTISTTLDTKFDTLTRSFKKQIATAITSALKQQRKQTKRLTYKGRPILQPWRPSPTPVRRQVTRVPRPQEVQIYEFPRGGTSMNNAAAFQAFLQQSGQDTIVLQQQQPPAAQVKINWTQPTDASAAAAQVVILDADALPPLPLHGNDDLDHLNHILVTSDRARESLYRMFDDIDPQPLTKFVDRCMKTVIGMDHRVQFKWNAIKDNQFMQLMEQIARDKLGVKREIIHARAFYFLRNRKLYDPDKPITRKRLPKKDKPPKGTGRGRKTIDVVTMEPQQVDYEQIIEEQVAVESIEEPYGNYRVPF